MVTSNAEPEPTEGATKRVGHGIRYIIAGHPDGAVRRITMHIIVLVAVALTLAFAGQTVGLVFGTIALIFALILAMTDQLA